MNLSADMLPRLVERLQESLTARIMERDAARKLLVDMAVEVGRLRVALAEKDRSYYKGFSDGHNAQNDALTQQRKEIVRLAVENRELRKHTGGSTPSTTEPEGAYNVTT